MPLRIIRIVAQGDNSAPVERVCVRVLPDGRMAAREGARYLGVTEKSLANWRSDGAVLDSSNEWGVSGIGRNG